MPEKRQTGRWRTTGGVDPFLDMFLFVMWVVIALGAIVAVVRL